MVTLRGLLCILRELIRHPQIKDLYLLGLRIQCKLKLDLGRPVVKISESVWLNMVTFGGEDNASQVINSSDMPGEKTTRETPET